MIFVLDASAMIAFLRDEPGAHVVSEALFDPRTPCHAHAFHRAAGREEALRAVADLARLGVMQRLHATILTSDHHEFDALVAQSVCDIRFIR